MRPDGYPAHVPSAVQPVIDPLQVRVELKYRGQFFPRGLPVTVSSNSHAVLDAARISWGAWTQRFDEAAVDVRCVVQEGGPPAEVRTPTVRAQRNLLASVCDDANFAMADLAAGRAAIWVTEATVADTETFRYQFLEAMAYCVLGVLHVVDLHAACVRRNGKGILLAGDSGAGKSSLAYACARDGWIYVSDDGVSLLQRSESPLVIGSPGHFRFRGSARDLFPEFEGWTATLRANRKPSIEVPTKLLPSIRTAADSHVDFILLLSRGPAHRGCPLLIPAGKQQVLDQLFQPVWPDELMANQERHHAIERLLRFAEAYELRYETLAEAITLLNRLTGLEENE
jgi:hypothetical protein